MSNPLINPGKLAQGFANSQIQTLLAEVQKGNPAVLGRIMQLYQKPYETLSEVFGDNSQMQQQLNQQMKDKPLKEQQGMLLSVMQNEGIDVRGIAAKFGISL